MYLMTFRDRAKFVLIPDDQDYDKLYKDFIGDDDVKEHGWPSL